MSQATTIGSAPVTTRQTQVRKDVPAVSDNAAQVDSVGPAVEALKSNAPPVLPAIAPSNGRGLAIICFDGVSYNTLKEAIDAGKMPNMAKLVKDMHYDVHKFFPGLPCTTPATMCGVAWGDNPFPAYTWYNKAEDKSYCVDNYPDFDSGFEGPASKSGNPGLFTKGAVEVALVSGGSSKVVLSTDAMSKIATSAGSGTSGAMNYIAGLTDGYASNHPEGYVTAVQDTLHQMSDLFAKDTAEEGIARLITSAKGAAEMVLLSSVGVGSVEDSMKDNVPVIFTDDPSYDATSHEYGPGTPETDVALARIDRGVGKIMAEAVAPGHRGYELAFFSDHGHTAATSFEDKYGTNLPALASSLAGGANVEHGPSGSLDNLYFTATKTQMSLTDLQAKYPGMVDKLVAHPGIDLVIGRDNGATVIQGKDGKIVVDKGQVTSTGANILAPYESPRDTIITQLNRLANLPNSGDVIVMGHYEGNGHVIAFEPQAGSHGGLGGNQNESMFVTEPGRNLDTSKLNNASDMYHVFRSMLPVDGRP